MFLQRQSVLLGLWTPVDTCWCVPFPEVQVDTPDDKCSPSPWCQAGARCQNPARNEDVGIRKRETRAAEPQGRCDDRPPFTGFASLRRRRHQFFRRRLFMGTVTASAFAKSGLLITGLHLKKKRDHTPWVCPASTTWPVNEAVQRKSPTATAGPVCDSAHCEMPALRGLRRAKDTL